MVPFSSDSLGFGAALWNGQVPRDGSPQLTCSLLLLSIYLLFCLLTQHPGYPFATVSLFCSISFSPYLSLFLDFPPSCSPASPPSLKVKTPYKTPFGDPHLLGCWPYKTPFRDCHLLGCWKTALQSWLLLLPWALGEGHLCLKRPEVRDRKDSHQPGTWAMSVPQQDGQKLGLRMELRSQAPRSSQLPR